MLFGHVENIFYETFVSSEHRMGEQLSADTGGYTCREKDGGEVKKKEKKDREIVSYA